MSCGSRTLAPLLVTDQPELIRKYFPPYSSPLTTMTGTHPAVEESCHSAAYAFGHAAVVANSRSAFRTRLKAMLVAGRKTKGVEILAFILLPYVPGFPACPDMAKAFLARFLRIDVQQLDRAIWSTEAILDHAVSYISIPFPKLPNPGSFVALLATLTKKYRKLAFVLLTLQIHAFASISINLELADSSCQTQTS